MNTLNKIKIMVLFTFISLGQSCNIDDVVPLNQLTDANVIRDEKSAQLFLNGIYTLWRDFSFSNATFLTEAQGNSMLLTGRIFGDGGFAANDILDTNGQISQFYSKNYTIANNANWLIFNLEAGNAKDISEMRKNEMLAEARFHRAMSYFHLLRSFGQFYNIGSELGIVLRDKPSREIEVAARSTVQQSYDFIIADLQYVVANAPTSVANKSYVSQTTARALLAKVYLYMGDYANAATMANQAIASGAGAGYALEPSYVNIFTGQHLSQEVVFAPFINGEVENMSALSQILRTRFSDELMQLADNQMAGPGDIFTGLGFDPRFAHAFSFATRGIYQHAKYAYPVVNFSGAPGRFGLTKFYLRLGEIYLVEAEALARAGAGVNAAALARVNEIRTRAGVPAIAPATKAELLTAIFNEKRLELFGENGELWYDLVRYDRLGDISAASLKPSINNESKLIYPMPRQALANNNLLKPNP